ncbi:AzlD domain-containing protein [Pollutimonas sp. M17]|uniref:AzlD domain-containing protein n=1 Tax=Pollutimonas sp. M17 TaxID=2962065 RepID=UPI0021F432FF|nr:AzlD domain-containing protein [Pollutimonas sp. M17]UYO92863.1 AzlD domain-containing protein [Pollutimonas sp. M17]HWK70875.1 AzlD domain-containing protein [Burkholderiaceae bacterium]
MTGDLDYDLYILGVIGLLTLCSVLTRAGYFLFGDYLPLSEPVRRALRYAPTAALIAIVVPELLPWRAGAGPAFDIKVVAALVAILVFWRTRSTVLIIVGGMVAYWLLKALF